MMEMAKNVRDVLVGMKDVMSPEEENLLSSLQELHEKYLSVMDEFSAQVSNLALSMRPESRIVAHQLRLRIYQDWRANLMERIFGTIPLLSSSPPTRVSPPSTPIVVLDAHDKMEKPVECGCDVCVCHLLQRLKSYEKVISDYLQTSTKLKSKKRIAPTEAMNLDNVPKRLCETINIIPTSVSVVSSTFVSVIPSDASDDSMDEQETFIFPEFLNITPPSSLT